jgi:hypothetical protein
VTFKLQPAVFPESTERAARQMMARPAAWLQHIPTPVSFATACFSIHEHPENHGGDEQINRKNAEMVYRTAARQQ